MSKDHNTVICCHGKGLACPICYDQTINKVHNAAAHERARQRQPRLKTEQDTTEMHHRIVAAAAKILNRPKSNIATHFEHGQWWVEDLTLGHQYSVVDAEGGGSIDGFDLEQVTEGNED